MGVLLELAFLLLLLFSFLVEKSQVQFCMTAAVRKAKGKDFEIQPIDGKGMAAVAQILG